MLVLSRVWLFATPWTVVHQAPQATKFPRQEYWSVLPFPSPGDLPHPVIKPMTLALAGRFFTTGPPGKPIAIFISNTAKFRVPLQPNLLLSFPEALVSQWVWQMKSSHQWRLGTVMLVEGDLAVNLIMILMCILLMCFLALITQIYLPDKVQYSLV